MEGGLWATALGTVAGICSTVSFVPQVIKAWRENDTEAISKRMYFVTVTAFVLWTIYGFAIGSLPIIVFNLLTEGNIARAVRGERIGTLVSTPESWEQP